MRFPLRRSSCPSWRGCEALTGISAEVLRLVEMNELVGQKLAGAQILFCTDTTACA